MNRISEPNILFSFLWLMGVGWGNVKISELIPTCKNIIEKKRFRSLMSPVLSMALVVEPSVVPAAELSVAPAAEFSVAPAAE